MSSRHSIWIAYVFVALVTGIGYVVVLNLWSADPAVSPYYAYGGDVMTNMAWARGLFEYGNLYHAPLLAAPLGSETYDFPVFIAAQLPIQKLFGLLSGNGYVALNLTAVLSLPAAAMAAFLALRRLDVPTVFAFAPAVLFAFAPRFAVGEGRADLPEFWIIPLSAAMCVLISRGNVLLFEHRNGRLRIGLDGGFVSVVAALTGASNQYYAFFTIALLSAAALIATVRTRSVRPVLVSACLAVIITVGIFLQVAPSLAYQYRQGRNTYAFVRYPQEAQVYALQVAQLLLPIQGHRGPRWITEKRQYYDVNAPYAMSEVGAESLGAIASVGFIALLVSLLVRAAKALPYDVEDIALLNCCAVLLSIPSGFGALFNYYVNPDIRAYNRISLFISFFALAGLTQILVYAGRRWNVSTPFPARAVTVASVIAFGVWDQTTPALIPPYAASATEFHSDARFVSAVESQIGSGAAFELPWMRFPESPPIGTLVQGDLYRPYLHAKTLRTTFGAVEGRDPYRWQQSVALLAPGDMVRAAILGGFDGFIVFRQGFADYGTALERELRLVTGQPIESPDGSHAFYSARKIRDRVVAADPEIGTPWYAERTVRRIEPIMGPTFYNDGPNSTLPVWRSTSSAATILVRNSSSRKRPCVLRGLLELAPGDTSLHISTADAAADVGSASRPTAFAFLFSAAPGKTIIHLTAISRTFNANTLPQSVNYKFRLTTPSIQPMDMHVIRPAANLVLADALAPIATADEFGSRRVRLVEGCWPLESLSARHWNWCGRTARLRLESDRSEKLQFSAVVVTPGTPKSRLFVEVGGRRRQFQIVSTGTPIHLDVDVSPKAPVVLMFSTDARRLKTADPRELVLEFVEPTLRSE